MPLHDAKTTRRALLAGSAAALAGPALAQAPRRLVFATYGGTWEKAMREAWFDPFTKRTGIAVVSVSGNTYGKVAAMVAAGRTEWDVVEVNPDFQWIGARDNLLEKLDFGVIDRRQVIEGRDLVTDFATPEVLWSHVMFVNTRSFPGGQAPASWADVWDVSRFPGKRAFPSKANGGTLEAALLADGAKLDASLYPLDVPRALRALDRIKDHILWYDTNAQAEQMMADGQAVVGMVPDGRALSAKQRNPAIAIEYNQSLLTWASLVVPRGAPNREAAMQFLAYALSAEAQAAIAKAYTYGPINAAAFGMIPQDRASLLSGGPQQRGKYVLVDERWWGENLEGATEKLNAWRLG